MTIPFYHFHLIAPAGSVFEPEKLDRAIAYLQSLGHTVSEAENLRTSYQRFAGDDEARLQSLYTAVEHPNATHILAARGGYGMSRLLHNIDFARLAAGNKVWIGHSDINYLQLGLLAKTGQTSLCGPLACFDFGAECLDELMMHSFWQTLQHQPMSTSLTPLFNEHTIPSNLSGRLWGGNLAVVYAMLVGGYLPDFDDGILFLEDVGVHPYQIERMLWSLFHSGLLARQKAVIFGQFSEYKLVARDDGFDLLVALRRVMSEVNVPSLMNLDFGHVARKLTLPQGGHVILAQENAHNWQLNYRWVGL